VSTPIGLNIGAETPEEIAVAIVAEILMLRNGESGNRMIDGSRKK
jgi:xanthine dehydrogenase accessory factor